MYIIPTKSIFRFRICLSLVSFCLFLVVFTWCLPLQPLLLCLILLFHSNLHAFSLSLALFSSVLFSVALLVARRQRNQDNKWDPCRQLLPAFVSVASSSSQWKPARERGSKRCERETERERERELGGRGGGDAGALCQRSALSASFRLTLYIVIVIIFAAFMQCFD